MITTSSFNFWKKTMPCSSLSAILMAVNPSLTKSSTACAGKGGWKPMRTDIDISPEELIRLKTLAQKATPEPWQPSFVAGCVTIGQNQVYIAAVHPGVFLAMCEEIERLRDQVATQEVLSGEDDACMTQLEVERDALEEQVARLEKEADWLAREVSSWEHDQLDGTSKHIREVPELREAARKAVEGI